MGQAVAPPYRDGDERWLAEITDPAGNRIGVVGSGPGGPGRHGYTVVVASPDGEAWE